MNLRKYRDLEMEVKLGRIGVAGRYRLTKGKTMGGVMDLSTGRMLPGSGLEVITGQTDWFENIITNNGMNKIADELFSARTTYAHVGTGTTAEVAADTGLETFLASTNTIQSSALSAQGSAPYYGKYVQTYRFAEGDAEGVLSEVGVSDQATTGDLFSRSLIKDGGGSPTTITVLSDEWLDVTYEFRLYPDHILSGGGADDGSGTIDISGISHDYDIRPCNITNSTFHNAQQARARMALDGSSYGIAYGSDGALGAATSTPTGSSTDNITTSNSTIAQAAYSNGTFARQISLILGLNDGNVSGGVKAMYINTGMGSYQMLFDPVVPKTSSKVWTFNTVLAWARATIP